VSLPDGLHRGFGAALRELRTQAGWSQERLADESGLTRNYISDLELGRKSPSLRSIARIAKALGVRPHELVTRAEDRTGRRLR
jgi:transcriptional regulator with XRE-family HTH domain